MIAQKILHFTFPWKSLGKYVIASATMATILILIPHPQKLLATLAITFLGEQFIWQHCWAMDKETGELVRLTIREIRVRLLRRD